MTDVRKSWFFKVCVREGRPGWSDDDEYLSIRFTSFEECFRAYLVFRPFKYWSYCRHVQREEIIFCKGNKITVNNAKDGMVYYNMCEDDLGITENEFDEILNSINSANKRAT